MKILGNVDYLTKNKELCILLKSSTIKIGCYDEYIENLQMTIIVFVNFSYREKKITFDGIVQSVQLFIISIQQRTKALERVGSLE